VLRRKLKRKSYIIERQENLNNIFGRGDKNNFNSLTLIICNHNVRAYICTFLYLKQRINTTTRSSFNLMFLSSVCVCGGGGTISYVQWNNQSKEYQAFFCLLIWVHPSPPPPDMHYKVLTSIYVIYVHICTGSRKTKRKGSGGAIAAVSSGGRGYKGYTKDDSKKTLPLPIFPPYVM
jgi:hypothetical protein